MKIITVAFPIPSACSSSAELWDKNEYDLISGDKNSVMIIQNFQEVFMNYVFINMVTMRLVVRYRIYWDSK